MKYYFSVLFFVVLVIVSLAGFRGCASRRPPIEIFPDMVRQAKLRPQSPNSFFGDGLSSRQPLAGTVARNSPWQDVPENTGRITGSTNFVETIPVPVTRELMARGRERFQIYCAPCHNPIGDGNGIVTKYGILRAGNYHEPRIVRMSDGELFNTISNGKNLMAAYGSQVPSEDRWAIIAYIRALQRARIASIDDVPTQDRAALEK
jgi:mono/diheme cytochrome c family protein